MTRDYRFVQVDVFTDGVFGGNPLAVFLGPRGLSDAEMQAIAAEMNLSETTFVLPPGRAECVARVRIFTPTIELPFAGHPTVGTAYVLATQGRLPAAAREHLLDEQIGPVAVRLEGDPTAPSFIWMRHQDASFAPLSADPAALARMLGLGAADLLPGVPPEIGSTGVPFLYVPLRDRAAVDRALLDRAAQQAVFADATARGVFVLAPDPDPRGGRVYTRMFGTRALGMVEDPATGAASGALGAYLLRHGLVAPADEVRVVSEQGTRMGRQRFVHIRFRAEGRQARAIEVGGSVVPVLEGVLRLA